MRSIPNRLRYFLCGLALVGAVSSVAAWRMRAASVAGQEGQPGQAGENAGTTAPSGPIAMVERDVIDIGSVLPGSLQKVVFRVRNDGNESLEIRELRTSCGCAPVVASTTEVAAGDEATLTMTFTVQPHAGPIGHALWFQTNDEDKGEFGCQARGRAEWPVDASPVSVHVRRAEPSAAVKAVVEVFSPTMESFEIEGIEPSDAWMTATIIEDAPTKKRIQLDLVTGDGRAREGTLRVRTSCATRPEIVLPVGVLTQSAQEVSPSRILLGTGKSGDVRAVIVRVRHKGAGTAEQRETAVAGVVVSDAAWAVTHWSVKSAERHSLVTISIRLPAPAGFQRAVLTIETGGQDARKIEVPVSCLIGKADGKSTAAADAARRAKGAAVTSFLPRANSDHGEKLGSGARGEGL
jgi:hypothetical protein